MKKSIIFVSLASVSAIACSLAFALNGNKGIDFQAVKANGEQRSYIFNNSNKPTINAGAGSLVEKNIGVILPFCSESTDGFAVIEGNDSGDSYNKNGVLAFYCATAGTYWGGYRGFESSTIDSVRIVFKNTNKRENLKLDLYWCSINNTTNLVNQWNNGPTFTSDASGNEEEFLVDSTHNSEFLTYQSDAVGAGLSCFGIKLSGNATWKYGYNEYDPVEIISVEITFTCD